MSINEVIEEFRSEARFAERKWYPGIEQTKVEMIVNYIEYLEKRNAALNQQVSNLLWQTDTTKWGA